MNFETFRRRAEEIFDDIPPDYREGVDGLEVVRKTVTHPTLAEVYTLGECLSDFYPSDYGGPGEIRSRVVLYYGSFLELARSKEGWDWEEELFETVTHEVRHHLEHLASEDALEAMDYAEDQNFARRDGEPFDHLFYRSGKQIETGAYEVDGDVFVERAVSKESGDVLDVEVKGKSVRFDVPAEASEAHFVRIPEHGVDITGDLFVVLLRRKGLWETISSVLRRDPVRVLKSEARMPTS
ncbi:MAG: metallopeptidase family protein [Gemmatimonadota bacterium]